MSAAAAEPASNVLRLADAPPPAWKGQRWEYRTRRLETLKVPDEALERKLNDLGADGWEVVGVQDGSTGVRVYLKRPARTAQPGRVSA